MRGCCGRPACDARLLLARVHVCFQDYRLVLLRSDIGRKAAVIAWAGERHAIICFYNINETAYPI